MAMTTTKSTFVVESNTILKARLNMNNIKLPVIKYETLHKLINYMLSVNTLEDVFKEKFTNSNYTNDLTKLFNYELKSNVLLKHFKDGDISKRLIPESYIRLEYFIKLLFTVNNNNKLGNYNEYIPFHRILLDRPFSLNSLKGYIDDNLISTGGDYYRLLNPRDESLVTEWIINMMNNDEYIKEFISLIIPDYQVELDDNDKKFDMGLFIEKNNDKDNIRNFLKYKYRILIEVQEPSYNHNNSKNDMLKNSIAINNNCLIYYFSMEDCRRNQTIYLSNFWELIKSKLLGALLQNPENGDKWFQVAHGKRLEKELLLAVNKQHNYPEGSNEYNKYNIEIMELLRQTDTNSKDQLLKLFSYKYESTRNMEANLNDQVIDYDDVLKLLQLDVIPLAKLKNELIINNYSQFTRMSNKYYINWSFFLQIISLHAKEDIRKDLNKYLISLEVLYPRYSSIIKTYLIKHIDILRNKNNLDKQALEIKYKQEIDELKMDNVALHKINNNKNSLLLKASNIFSNIKAYKDSIIVMKDSDGRKIYGNYNELNLNTSTTSFKDILKLTDRNNKITLNNDMKVFDYEINTKDNGESIIVNVHNFPIHYSIDELDQITYEGFLNICTEYNIPQTIQTTLIKLLVYGNTSVKNIVKPTTIKNLKVNSKYADYQLYNVVANPVLGKPFDLDAIKLKYRNLLSTSIAVVINDDEDDLFDTD